MKKLKRIIKCIYFFIRFGKITERVVERMDGIPCEVAYYAKNGDMIGYWAYGCFDPDAPYRGE